MIRIRACYPLLYNHPLLLFMLLFMIYLRISSPYVFFLLISASPVVICTAILLTALLALGQKHAQGAQNDALMGHKVSSSRPNCTSQSNCFLRDKFAEVRKDIVEKEMKEPSLIGGSNIGNGNKNVDHLMFVYNEESKKQLNGESMDHCSSSSPSSSSSVYEDESDLHPRSSIMPTLCDYHPLADLEDHHDQVLHEDDDDSLKGNKRAKGMKEDDEVSSIEEDHQEILEMSSSDNEHKQQLEGLIEERSDDYDIDEHDDDDEEEEDEEEEEEDHKVKQECMKTMVNWTEEDEKNLKDLSRLELERNRQLERIMTKRIAQKTYSTVTEKSLMDLDMSDLPFTVAPISTAKTNPFDVSCPASYQPKKPHIPGSAPAFFPRRNPFDDMDDSHHENKPAPRHVSFNTDHKDYKSEYVNLEKDSVFLSRHQSFNRRHHHEEREGGGPQDSAEVTNREALFRRYQSFGVVGSSFYGFLWQDNEEVSSNPFRPYFVPHEADHPDNINGSDSPEHDSSQGSISETSSSSTDVTDDQEEAGAENASESSIEIDMDESHHKMEEIGTLEAGEETKKSNVIDDAMKVEHVEPVYDTDTSPSTVVKNIFLSSESSSDLQERKSEM